LRNILGIDFGRKRVGAAFAPDSSMAFRLCTLNNDNTFWESLQKIIKQNSVEEIVVGLPISMDGTHSAETKNVLNFVKELKQKFENIKVHTYDERLSTQEAKKNIPAGVEDHEESARIILEGFLGKKNV